MIRIDKKKIVKSDFLKCATLGTCLNCYKTISYTKKQIQMIRNNKNIGSNDTRIVPYFFYGNLLYTPERERTPTSIEFIQ